MNSDQAFEAAVAHHQAGRLGEAERLYRQVLRGQPAHGAATHNLGLVLIGQGKLVEAEEAFEKCVQLNPAAYQAWFSLGNVLRDLGKRDEAVAAYRRGVALLPDEPDCLNGLAGLLRTGGQREEAMELYRRALRSHPDSFQTHHNYGNALLETGDRQAAVASFRRALAIEPRSFVTHQALIRALMTPQTLKEAIAAVQAAAAIWPNSAIAYDQLAVLLYADQRVDESEAAYRQAIAADPNYFLSHNGLGHLCQQTGRIDQALACYERAAALAPNNAIIASNRIYALQFKPDFDPAVLRRELAAWNERFVKPLAQARRPHPYSREPNRRLRIGYVSADFREHVVGWNLLPLLTHHDSAQAEVFCYSGVEKPDAMTEKLKAHAAQWRSLLGLDDPQAAELIRQDGIDILVDLSLHSAGNRLLVFAHKPAPVQMCYLGYAGSTGLETMDYRISDPFLDPPDADLAAYRETTLRLAKSYWCYQPGGEAAEAGRGATDGVTFGCMCNFSRVSPATVSLWAKIMAEIPEARLVIYCPSEQRREPFLHALGIAPDRVEFLARQPWDQYARTYDRIDISLDPIPFGGGITTCDSLWMGVPVITLAGSTAVARAACSVLGNVGLAELIAQSPDDYVKLARDWQRWIALRPTLRQRMRNSALMDGPGFARDMESVYRQAWNRYCSR